MYLFTRTARLQPSPDVDPVATTVSVTERVSEVTGRPTACYRSLAGAAAGTYRWSQRVRHIGDHVTGTAALAADEAYAERVAPMAPLITGEVTDELLQPIGDLGHSIVDPGGIVAVVTATAIAGDVVGAVGWMLELAGVIEKASGRRPDVLRTVAGGFEELVLVDGFVDGDAIAAHWATIAEDDGYLAASAGAADHVVAGSMRSSLWLRLV